MIKQENLKQVLKELNFIELEKNIFTKKFEKFDCELKVDFDKKILIFPEDKWLIVNDKTTSNFKAPENFVVFECVNRLLEQWYKPNHIELEPKWQVGHWGSGWKADILVKDNSWKSLLIIECKTAWTEFSNAWKNTLIRPTQVFSYAQQTRTTQFIALYTSDFIDNKINSKYYLISLKDNDELLENNKKLESYKNASEVEDIYSVWSETYKKEYSTVWLFENNEAYKIGKTNFSIDDLKTISSKDIAWKYHEFATILRQHNVSGRENAFDKLVNLFLCKVVDEKYNPEKLNFYWKWVAYDDPFSLQDRLQKLYSEWMEKFLWEKITYIENNQIDQAFRFFHNKPKETKDVIKEYFKELKFFTNNDFAFIDIHNEKLFYQNFEVFLKIIKIFQDIKLTGSEENQFLWDMFEWFLDQWVKQSEWQFFTPMPIVKFITHSLPKLKNPKVIDYACWAGHFLNEYALKNKGSKIFWIEKEYRLSKVAKVSAFMYWNDDMKIIYADWLVENKKVENNSFDVLVANPPYSVKGFLETLTQEQREKYEITKSIDKKSYSSNNSIECFFIERAKQLLKDWWVASIIVPSSILNKANKVYSTTREIILKYFNIVAIYESGSWTFWKTWTNTVTLFLKKKKTHPTQADHFKNMIDVWFDWDTKTNNEKYKNFELLEKYCNYLELNFEDYKEFLKSGQTQGIDPTENNILKTEIFQEYQKDFDKLTTTKNYKKKSFYKNFSSEKKQDYNFKEFIKYSKEIEKEKVFYFSLAYKNETDVVIIKSPSNNTEIKKFLWYEWSNSKWSEWIQYITNNSTSIENKDDLEESDKRVLENINSLSNIQTPLYNPNNSDDETKINKIISNNFENKNPEIPEDLQKFVSKSKLLDMLDFTRTTFDKAINLNPKRKIQIESKWEIVKIWEICDLKAGSTPSRQNNNYWNNWTIKWLKINDFKDFDNIYNTSEKITELALNKTWVKLLPKNTVVVTIFATIWRVWILKEEMTTNQAIIWLIIKDNKILNYFLMIIIKFYIESLLIQASGSAQLNINWTILKDMKIPLPPLNIQQKIIDECEIVDKEVEKAENNISKNKKEIENIIWNVDGEMVKLWEVAEIKSWWTPKTEIKEYWNWNIFWATLVDTKEKYLNYTKRKITKLWLEKSSAKLLPVNTVIFSSRATIWETTIAKVETATNQWYKNFICDKNKINYEFLYYILKNEAKNIESLAWGMTYKEINKTDISNFKIPLPSLEIQKQIVSKIEIIEKSIEESKKIIEWGKERKEKILKSYL